MTIAPLGQPREAMEWVSAQGVRGVQLSAAHVAGHADELGTSALRDVRATLRRLELVCAGIDAWVPPGDWLLAERVDRVVAACTRAIALAGALDRVPVVLAVPARSARPAEEAHRRDALAAIAQQAERHGVLLADATPRAPHTRDEPSAGLLAPAPHVVARPPRAQGDGPGFPPVGVCIDPAAVLATGHRVHDALVAAAGRVVAARVCDLLRSGMRGPVGSPDGQLDLLEYRATLGAVGFAGLPVIDARQWAHPHEGVTRSLEAWRGAAVV